MAFLKISDGIGELECVVFPATFGISKEFLVRDNVILAWGRVDKRDESLSLVVENVSPFDPENAPKIEKVVEIEVPRGTRVNTLQEINKTLRGFPGDVRVTLILPNGGSEPRRMILPFSIDPGLPLETEITQLLGEGAFRRI